MASSTGEIFFKLGSDTSGLDKGSEKIKSFEKGVTTSNKRVASSSRTASTAIRALSTALAGLISVRVGKAMLDTAAAMTRARIQIKSATNSTQQFNTVMARLQDLSIRTGVPLSDLAVSFQSLALAANTLGLRTSDMLTFIEGLQNVAIITGTSIDDLQGFMTQLNEAASTGKLRWQDFRIALQRSPAVADALAKSLGVTTKELIEATSSGIGMEKIIRALNARQDELAEKASKTTTDWDTALQTLQSTYSILIGEIDKALGTQKFLVGIIKNITSQLDTLEKRKAVAQKIAAGWMKVVEVFSPVIRALSSLGTTFLTVSTAAILFGSKFAMAGALLSKGLGGVLLMGAKVAGVFLLKLAVIGLVIAAVTALVQEFFGFSSTTETLEAGIKVFNSALIILSGTIGIVSEVMRAGIRWFKDWYSSGSLLSRGLQTLVGWIKQAAGWFGELMKNFFKESESDLGKNIFNRMEKMRTEVDALWNPPVRTNVEVGAAGEGGEGDGEVSKIGKADIDPNTEIQLTPKEQNFEAMKEAIVGFKEWEHGVLGTFNILNIDAAAAAKAIELENLMESQNQIAALETQHLEMMAETRRQLAEQQALAKEEQDAEEIERLINKLSTEEEIEQDFLDRKKELEEQEEKLRKAKEAKEDASLKRVMDGAAKKSKEFWLIQKASAIAQATLDIPAAVSAAYRWGAQTGGVPLAAAYAGIAAAAGAINLAAVVGTTFEGRRFGGEVEAGKPYRVGEAGVEMLRMGGQQIMIPSEDGAVIPNNRLGGGGGASIKIYNNAGVRVTPSVVDTADGEQIAFILDQVEQRLAQGIRDGDSVLSGVVENAYGLSRGLGSF